MATQSRQSGTPPPQAVLLTRPAAQGARFARQLEAAFPGRLRLIPSPLIEPVWVDGPVPRRDWTAVLLTSETGAEAALRRRLADGLPARAFCVGRRTAEVAAAGFAPLVAAGDAQALVALVAQSGLAGPMLHLRGRDARGDVAARLCAAGIETAEVIVYDQRPYPLNAAAIALLHAAQPVIVPLFSPRTTSLFVAEAQRLGAHAPLHIAALSPAVAAELGPLVPAALEVAAAPDAPAMLAAIDRLLGDSRLS